MLGCTVKQYFAEIDIKCAGSLMDPIFFEGIIFSLLSA